MENKNIILREWRRAAQMELEGNILPFWLRLEDPVGGGFYGQVNGTGVLNHNALRGGILYARILWAFSAAYRFSPQVSYLEAAHRAFRYIEQHFVDPEYGGTYWSVKPNGQPHSTRKQFYDLAFNIYALAEYFMATANEKALKLAISLYHDIELHSIEPAYGGYIEATGRDWSQIADMRLSPLDANYPKSQNTHLHILEAYTNLYRVWPSDQLRQSLRNLIDIFHRRIVDIDTYHLNLFFTMEWMPGGDRIESYGHDIEFTWLLTEAAEVLCDPEVTRRVLKLVDRVAVASRKGLNPDGSMNHEGNVTQGTVDTDRHWWVQAETVIGFLNHYQLFGDEESLDQSYNCNQYINRCIVDHRGGEWYWSRNAQGQVNTKDDKAGFWKCPYHNSRMCLEILNRITPGGDVKQPTILTGVQD